VDQKIEQPFRLYHGTSVTRLGSILSQNQLHLSQRPDRRVCLTTSSIAAEYAACEAVSGDFFNTALINEVRSSGQRLDATGFTTVSEYFANNLDHNLRMAQMVHFALYPDSEGRVIQSMLDSVRKLAQASSAGVTEQANAPVVLVLDGDRMLDLGYRLSRYFDKESDDYRWEDEIACWQVIAPLDAVLLGMEAVELHQLETFIKGRHAFMGLPRRSASLNHLRRGVLAHLKRTIELRCTSAVDPQYG